MSTTSNGAFSPVVRRMMPSGSVASGEPAGGVVQPCTQVGEGAPRVFGRLCGSAGCVGDGRGDAVVADGLGEAALEGVDAAEVAPVEASQDTAASAASIAIGSREGLRIG
jgi:hypothetical protein